MDDISKEEIIKNGLYHITPNVNPTMKLYTVKILPKSKEELVNYKVRSLSDDVIMYEGYCKLMSDEVKKVQLVPDREDRRKKFLEELNVIGKENSEDSNIRETTQKHIINNKEVER